MNEIGKDKMSAEDREKEHEKRIRELFNFFSIKSIVKVK
jgi:hypothetical protein